MHRHFSVSYWFILATSPTASVDGFHNTARRYYNDLDSIATVGARWSKNSGDYSAVSLETLNRLQNQQNKTGSNIRSLGLDKPSHVVFAYKLDNNITLRLDSIRRIDCRIANISPTILPSHGHPDPHHRLGRFLRHFHQKLH